ncbi:MAG: type II secretion system F family protein [Candidatus Omnitrophica bacterium]|nr:type II secretion system F family protein [Candidatus Omnitrophota bacterium]
MSRFAYRARDTMGKPVKGSIEADTKTEVIDRLNKMNYMATYVGEIRPSTKLESMLQGLKRVRSDDMLLFFIQFSNMINAGIPILTCLHTLEAQIENVVLKKTVRGVANNVEGGDSLSQAFAGFPFIFPRLFTNMIKAGEASGKLDTVLARYAQFFEHQEDLRQQVKGALIYPIILLCAGLVVILIIVTFVIPQFAEIYMKAGIRLPIPTLIVYNIGTAIRHYWYLFVLALLLISTGIKYYSRTKRGTLKFDRLKLKIPVIGPLNRKVAIARFSRTLATLVGSGVPILESLDITRGVIENEILARVIDNMRGCVEKGDRMAGSLKISEEFPSDVIQMINVGEETGSLDTMLNKIADFYDMTVGYAVRRLTTLIEPFFLVIMGVMIGFIMASMLLPIFDMIKTLRH